MYLLLEKKQDKEKTDKLMKDEKYATICGFYSETFFCSCIYKNILQPLQIISVEFI